MKGKLTVNRPDPYLLITRPMLDGRTQEARSFDLVREEFRAALGGDLSPQKEQLLERAVFLMWSVTAFERDMLLREPTEKKKTHGRNSKDPVLNDYLALTGMLIRVLDKLGLNRVTTEKDLNEIMRDMSEGASDE